MGVASWISLTLAVRNTIDAPYVRDLQSVRGANSVSIITIHSYSRGCLAGPDSCCLGCCSHVSPEIELSSSFSLEPDHWCRGNVQVRRRHFLDAGLGNAPKRFVRLWKNLSG